MIVALLAAAVLSVTDPAGDAFGDGNLRMPTDLVFRTPGAFDARRIEVFDTDELKLAVTMETLNNPWELPLGFSLPIIELYLDAGGSPGQSDLLEGSGMSLPEGRSWDYALRVTGDRFQLFAAEGEGVVREVTDRYEATLSVEDNTILIETRLDRPSRFSLFGMVGGYDPFTESGWRPVLAEPSPFAFASTSQTVPVVDVIADTVELQVRAIETGVLPEIRAGTVVSGWLALAAVGVLLSLLGLTQRFLQSRRPNVEQPPQAFPRYEPLPSPTASLPWPLGDPTPYPALPPASSVAKESDSDGSTSSGSAARRAISSAPMAAMSAASDDVIAPEADQPARKPQQAPSPSQVERHESEDHVQHGARREVATAAVEGALQDADDADAMQSARQDAEVADAVEGKDREAKVADADVRGCFQTASGTAQAVKRHESEGDAPHGARREAETADAKESGLPAEIRAAKEGGRRTQVSAQRSGTLMFSPDLLLTEDDDVPYGDIWGPAPAQPEDEVDAGRTKDARGHEEETAMKRGKTKQHG